jgi:hypothetical protein
MKKWSFLFLALLLATACTAEGENVHNGVTDDDSTAAEDVPGTDGESPEDVVEVDPGPAFKNILAWKVVNTGEKEVWNTLTGRVTEAGYEVYVGGGFGTVMWFESAKSKWHHVNLAETLSINGLWTDGPDYIAVCGEDGLLKRYYDFSRSGNPDWYNDDLSTGVDSELDSIHGYDRENLWAVGKSGAAVKFDGENWTSFTPAEMGLPNDPAPDLAAVLVLGPEKALIGTEGKLISYDAGAFTANDTDFAGYKLRALLETKDAVWVAADKGTVFRSDGNGGWEKHQANVYSQFKTLWLSPDQVLYAGGTQTDPTVWLYDGNPDDNWDYLAVESPKFIKDSYPEYRVDPQSRITGIWGTDSQNIFVCTKEKQVVHYAIHP